MTGPKTAMWQKLISRDPWKPFINTCVTLKSAHCHTHHALFWNDTNFLEFDPADFQDYVLQKDLQAGSSVLWHSCLLRFINFYFDFCCSYFRHGKSSWMRLTLTRRGFRSRIMSTSRDLRKTSNISTTTCQERGSPYHRILLLDASVKTASM